MIRILAFAIFSLVSASLFAQVSSPIIPIPRSIVKSPGVFNLSSETTIISDPTFQNQAHLLQKEILKRVGIAVPLNRQSAATKIIIGSARLNSRSTEAYELIMNSDVVYIRARGKEGAVNGIMSLMQLLETSPVVGSSRSLACWRIQDEPAYGWRGFMLDESRHFFGKKKVKSILEWMSFYKLNKLHWHLTDQPGWRIEIKGYPNLTLVGGIGNHTNPYAPATYYTQEDIKEIIQYATERAIDVIPEIDMPGHATAANKAYPEFSGGGSEKYPEFTFNPGKEKTYQYLTDVLKEVDVLFPSEMLHLGGDEVSFGNEGWETDADVAKLMSSKGLRDLKAVEEYFIKRMADSVRRLGNKVLAWDEVAHMDLPKRETVVFWWRHDKPEQLNKALENGYQTVISPRLPLYFDFVQDSTHQVGRRWNGKFNDVEAVYSFSTDYYGITPLRKSQILGIQANLWTETVSSESRLDYLMFPRISAFAEAAWSEQRNKNFKDFSERLKQHLTLYDKVQLYYYNPFDRNKQPVAIK